MLGKLAPGDVVTVTRIALLASRKVLSLAVSRPQPKPVAHA
jgi:hypothetical protein